MSQLIRSAVGISLGFIAINISFIPAHATQIPNPYPACGSYAKTAIKQYETMRDIGCNLTGARWSNRYADHYGWCERVRANKTYLQKETQARKNDLRNCR